MKPHRVFSHKVRRIVFAAAIAMCCAGACECQQQASSPLAFEVASIKPGSKDFHAYRDIFGPHIYPERASYIGMSLKSLFVYAYGLNFYQVTGPGWIDTDRYVIEAKFPDGTTGKDEKRMLQALLKERFKLAFHTEAKEEKVYELVVGKQGAMLKPSSEGSSGTDKDVPLRPGEQWTGDGAEKHKERYTFDSVRNIDHVESNRMTMNELARILTGILHNFNSLDYLVVDRTGLEGYYQVSVDHSRPTLSSQATVAAGGDDVGTLPSAPQGTDVLDRSLDAQGLKLKMAKAPVDVYVVDHAERPSDN